jgi:DNA-binding beta-propeller fold protein YncE
VGTDPSHVAVTPDGRDAYVTNQDGTVSVIPDVQTDHPQVVKPALTVGADPTTVAVTPDSKYAYVVNRLDHTVSSATPTPRTQP